MRPLRPAALASRIRVALPNVPVFAEAYDEVVLCDAFWELLDREDMVNTIKSQLARRSEGGGSDLNTLTSIPRVLWRTRGTRRSRSSLGCIFPSGESLPLQTALSFFIDPSDCSSGPDVQSFQRLPLYDSFSWLEDARARKTTCENSEAGISVWSAASLRHVDSHALLP